MRASRRAGLATLLVVGCGGGAKDTSPAAAPFEVLSATAVADDAPVNRLEIAVETTASASLEVWCALDADPTEVHHAVSDGVGTSLMVPVVGLLAEQDHTCALEVTDVATGGAVRRELVARTLPLPPELPEMVVTHPAGEASARVGGYTTFNHWAQNTDPKVQKAVIVDPEGRVRWYYPLDLVVAVGVEVNLGAPGLMLVGGGQGYPPTLLTLDQQPAYRSPDPVSGGVHHHHAELLPSGDILSLASSVATDGVSEWTGFVIELRQAWTGQLSWSWDSQIAVDAGSLPVGTEGTDAYHANAVQYVEDADGPAFYVSLWALNQVIRVDKETGEITWRLGSGGDFALLDASGQPADDAAWFYGQHDPEYALPRMFVHDNGYSRPGSGYTRALELELDLEARTATVVWDYAEEGWYEPIWGDVDLLPNGSFLVAQGHYDDGAGGEARHSSIIEVDPVADAVTWRLEFGDVRDGVYRADHIDGCDIFGNAAYCPTVPPLPDPW